jgi:hypothetical protein
VIAIDQTVIRVVRDILGTHGTSSQKKVDQLHRAVEKLLTKYVASCALEQAAIEAHQAYARRLLGDH